MLQPDFDPAPAAVHIYTCEDTMRCTARGCERLARLIARKVDAAGRPLRQVELCFQHTRVIVACESQLGLKIRDRRSAAGKRAVSMARSGPYTVRPIQPSTAVRSQEVLAMRDQAVPSGIKWDSPHLVWVFPRVTFRMATLSPALRARRTIAQIGSSGILWQWVMNIRKSGLPPTATSPGVATGRKSKEPDPRWVEMCA